MTSFKKLAANNLLWSYCVAAQRFALIEMKLGLSKIVTNYEFQVCEKTNVKVPFEYSKGSPLMIPEGGFWLNIKPLSNE